MSIAPEHRGQSPAASLGWRLRHSLWLLLPILGFGCLGGAGFLYVGFRARRPAWWIPGIVYMVLGWASFATVGETSTEDPISDVALGVFLSTYLVSIVHACLLNTSWLQWRAHYVPWYTVPSAPPPVWQQPAAQGASGFTVPAAFAGAAAFPGPSPFAVDPYARPVLVDVNTATAQDLARLPGLDPDRAHRAVAERARRGGFASVDEFAFAAGLAPHQFAPLRDRLTCAPPPLWEAPDGRVLDV